ncbi:hypothetical protein BT96DRAFT_1020481, partial [Gymnopus androsaceus JB14]
MKRFCKRRTIWQVKSHCLTIMILMCLSYSFFARRAAVTRLGSRFQCLTPEQLDIAAKGEKKRRQDVMAHVY